MYLSRIYLNPYRRGCKYLLASPQRLHAAVLASFPPVSSTYEERGRILWRVDRPRSRGVGSPALALYVSSPYAPDPAAIVEQAGYETEGGVQIKNLDSFHSSLRDDQLWRFRVTVNPTFRQSDQRGQSGRKKVLAHVTVKQQTQWFLNRCESHGFIVPNIEELGGEYPVLESAESTGSDFHFPCLELIERRGERFTRGRGDKATDLTLQLATFEGVLRVNDANLLRQTLVGGIGRAKAYGAGLLTLARM